MLPSTSTPPAISFLVCTRNRSETVEGCIKKLLECERQNIEVIVRDNNSDDNTLEVLKEINDSRFKLFTSPENQGTRNFFEISKLATGKVVTWLSDEDDFQFEHLDSILSMFEDDRCHVVLSSIIVGSNREVIFNDEIIEDPVRANILMLSYSGCGGLFVRASSLSHANSMKARNDHEAYILWNYYPISFFGSKCCANSRLQTTAKILVKQTRHANTTSNWSLNKKDTKKVRVPHYYPSSQYDRISSNIIIVLLKKMPLITKFRTIIGLFKMLYGQASTYDSKIFIDLLEENYGSQITNKYINHIKSLNIDKSIGKLWFFTHSTLKVLLYELPIRWIYYLKLKGEPA